MVEIVFAVTHDGSVVDGNRYGNSDNGNYHNMVMLHVCGDNGYDLCLTLSIYYSSPLNVALNRLIFFH